MMLRTYEAVLKGDRVEWRGETPDPSTPLRVHITVLSEEEPSRVKSDGRAMVAALEALAASGAFADIKDPGEWQREIRKDRPLPGREQ